MWFLSSGGKLYLIISINTPMHHGRVAVEVFRSSHLILLTNFV